MHCVSPKTGILPMEILLALKTAGTNALGILHARYSLIIKKRGGVQQVPSVPAGPSIAIMTFLLINASSRSPLLLLKVTITGSLVHAIIRLVIQYATSAIVFFRFTHSDSLMSCRSDFSWFRSRENRNPRGKSFDRLHDPLGMQGRLGVHVTSLLFLLASRACPFIRPGVKIFPS